MVSQGPLILLLEDEPIIAYDVEQTLKYYGFRVAGPLRSCSEALEWVAENDVDGVILDIKLQDGDCSEVAESLFSRTIPFIVHTAAAKGSEDYDPIFNKGHWVGKPSLPLDLLNAVKSLIIQRGTTDDTDPYSTVEIGSK